MALFSHTVDAPSLHALLLHELKDLYDAEHQILDALPKMIEEAQSRELKDAFTAHREETQMQVTRLEDCFNIIGEKPHRSTCEGMKGILREGEEILNGSMDPILKDAAMAEAGRKVEHYEIIGYTAARDHATELELPQVAELLQDTLQEEIDADQKLAAAGYRQEAKAAVEY